MSSTEPTPADGFEELAGSAFASFGAAGLAAGVAAAMGLLAKQEEAGE
jgi:hypothetical protein